MDTQQPPRTRRRIKLLLAASLALNLLLIGIFAGAIYRHGGGQGPGGPRLNSYGVPYMQALPRAERRALHGMLRKDGVVPDRKTRQAAYRAVLEGLRATPFDAAALEAEMAKQSQTVQRVQGAAQAAWLELVAQMPQEARLAYADALEERLNHRRRGHKKKHN